MLHIPGPSLRFSGSYGSVYKHCCQNIYLCFGFESSNEVQPSLICLSVYVWMEYLSVFSCFPLKILYIYCHLTLKAFSLISTAWPSWLLGFFPLWQRHWKCWHNTRLLLKTLFCLRIQDSGLASLTPHPTRRSRWDVVTAPARCRAPVCRFVSAAEWKVCQWFTGRDSIKGNKIREKKKDVGLTLKTGLKNIGCFFPLDSYVGHKGTVKKENLFFLKALFAVLWSLKRPQIQRLPQLYIFQGGLCLTLAKVISFSPWIRAEWTISVTSFHCQLHMLYNA